jgi:hypothetical protein
MAVPQKLSKATPRGIRDKINEVIDYATTNHIENVTIEFVIGASKSSVEMVRGQTGVIMNIKIAAVSC